MNLLPINENDLRIDIDRFVWVWNTLEHGWVRTTTWTANALHKTRPECYTHWMADDQIEVPKK